MSRLDRIDYRHRDIPQLEGININAQSAAGSGADYEHVICVVPDLSKQANLPSGSVGSIPLNTQQIRMALLTWEAAVTGVATNNFTININQKRGGARLVNTTISSGGGSTGLQTITPASMANIFNGMQLNFTGGTAEVVTVFNVTATTFQAVFANVHANASAILDVPIATVTYASGVNDVAYVTRVMTLTPHFLKPGDVVTIQRVSNGTGLASPAGTITLDWVNYGNSL